MTDAGENQDPEDMLDLGHFLRDQFPDDAPREPGRAKVMMGGEPRAHEGEMSCDYCGRVIRWSGVSFGEPMPCPRHPGQDCLSVHIHYGSDCPAIRWRLVRMKTGVTWPIERRWKSWRWRRRMSAERQNPEAWAHYWEDSEGPDSGRHSEGSDA